MWILQMASVLIPTQSSQVGGEGTQDSPKPPWSTFLILGLSVSTPAASSPRVLSGLVRGGCQTLHPAGEKIPLLDSLLPPLSLPPHRSQEQRWQSDGTGSALYPLPRSLEKLSWEHYLAPLGSFLGIRRKSCAAWGLGGQRGRKEVGAGD